MKMKRHTPSTRWMALFLSHSASSFWQALFSIY